jgi:hypothetical protein
MNDNNTSNYGIWISGWPADQATLIIKLELRPILSISEATLVQTPQTVTYAQPLSKLTTPFEGWGSVPSRILWLAEIPLLLGTHATLVLSTYGKGKCRARVRRKIRKCVRLLFSFVKHNTGIFQISISIPRII